ncbi:MAG: caspase family protein [Candidatus Thiodiazotropha taylori]|nr:caspase family protein [Candidatus Thiodiazotropha taylori]
MERRIPKGQKAGRYDIAVLVANGEYEHEGVPAVKYAHNDLKVMKKYLMRTMGYLKENIIIEKDASKGAMETLFGSERSPNGKLKRFVRRGKSRVFVYYVGHGAPDPDTGDGFFVPVDADPDYIANSGYALSTFYANLRKLPAKELVVVLDACFSGRTPKGLLFKNVSPALLKVKESASGIQTGAVFSSARGDQLSSWYPKKQHSLFTYYFLKGLQGEADRNQDKKITMGELNAYVSEEVEYMAGRLNGKTQQPKLEGKADLVLATYQ